MRSSTLEIQYSEHLPHSINLKTGNCKKQLLNIFFMLENFMMLHGVKATNVTLHSDTSGVSH